MVEDTPQTRAGFLHEPRSEQEVACLFGALLHDLDFPCVVDTVQTAFPDCLIRRTDTGEQLRLEFQLYGSHFREHGHPFEGCDGPVCWQDDWGTWPPGFRIVELADVVARKRPDLLLSSNDRGTRSPWNEATFLDQAARDGVLTPDKDIARRIMMLAAEHRLGPQWLPGPRAVFAVGDGRQFFKVWSNGRLTFPFSRLVPADGFCELADRLNQTVPKLELQPHHAGSKGKGGQLSDLFQSEEQLRRFFEVWLWFRNKG